MSIPLFASVHCIDGPIGCSLTTITDPQTKEPTQLVVAEINAPYVKRLVPVQLVKRTTSRTLYLSCSKKHFSKLEQLEKIVIHPDDGHVTHLVSRTAPSWV